MTHYYLSIEHPSEVRKQLLGTAKESVQLLKAQYALREIRKRKLELLASFAGVVDEIAEMFDQLQQGLPSHADEELPPVVASIKAEMKKEAEERKRMERMERAARETEQREARASAAPSKPKARPKPQPTPPPQPEPEDALEKLERKLSSIESKLNKL